MTFTFLHGPLPLPYIHLHHRLFPFHFSLPVRELQTPVFWIMPPACRDSKRWQVDRCRRVTASGGVISLICHKTRPAPGLESRTSFPLCTYVWNHRETRRVWHLTVTSSFYIAYVSLPPVSRRCYYARGRSIQRDNNCWRKNLKERGRMLSWLIWW